MIKNRNLQHLSDLANSLTHDEVVVPYASDCSFELLFKNIKKYNFNFTDKNIALMWSEILNNNNLFIDSLYKSSENNIEMINYYLLNSKIPNINAVNCFRLMSETTEEHLFGSKLIYETNPDLITNIIKKNKNISLVFSKKLYNITCLQDLKYLNENEKIDLLKYKNFLLHTNDVNDLNYYDKCDATKIQQSYLIWRKNESK